MLFLLAHQRNTTTMPQPTKNTLELVCRTCLKNCQTHFDIFNHRRNNMLLADMLGNCTSLEIQNEDGFPISICSDCMEKLISAFDFKSMVIESNTKLYELHQHQLIEKEQEICTDTENICMNEEAVIKTEQTVMTDIRCTNEDTLGNKAKTREMDLKVKLEFEPIDESCDFLDDLAGTISSPDRFRAKVCEKVKQTISYANLDYRNEINLGNQYSNGAMDVTEQLELRSLEKYADVLDQSDGTYIKIEQTTITDLHCKNEDTLGNQEDKERRNVEIQLEFESLEDSDGFLGDLAGTVLSPENPFGAKLCEKVKRTVSVADLHCEQKDALGNLECKKAESGFESLKKNDSVARLNLQGATRTEKCKKIEQTTITDLHCKNEDTLGNQEDKERRNVEVQLEFESLEDSDGFLGDLAGTVLSPENPFGEKICEEVKRTVSVADLHCVQKDALGNLECKKAESGFESLKKNDSVARLNLQGATRTEKCKKIKQTTPTAKRKKKWRHDNKRNAELLDNPDYKRIISSGLTKKQKNRETVFCTECNRTFSYSHYIKKHAYIHTGNLPYKYDKCEKRYPKEHHLRSRMPLHLRTRDFRCDTCDKGFFEKHHLKHHKAQTHSEEGPQKCNICYKSFKSKSALWGHTKVHVKNKEFLCDVCGKVFVQLANLTTHKRCHAIEKNLVCTTCGQHFQYKTALNQHFKRHHHDNPSMCQLALEFSDECTEASLTPEDFSKKCEENI